MRVTISQFFEEILYLVVQCLWSEMSIQINKKAECMLNLSSEKKINVAQ